MGEERTFEVLGLYLNDFHRLSITDPESRSVTEALNTETERFLEKTSDFQLKIDDFISLMNKMSKDTETEKLKCLGLRNRLQLVQKGRELEIQKLRALVAEKTMENERLKTEYESLMRLESQQRDFIEHYALEL